MCRTEFRLHIYKAVLVRFGTIMNQEEFSALIKKYQLGELSPEQKDLLDKWFEALGSNNSEIWSASELELLREKVMKQLLVEKRKEHSYLQRFRPWLPYAAAILLISLGGLYYYQAIRTSVGSKKIQHAKSSVENFQKIQPGSNKATLTLADGRTIILSSDHTGIIMGNDLVYEDGTALLGSERNESPKGKGVVHNYQLTTPKGGQYKMTLPDGSRVWLNAASKLKYPGRFNKEVREVELAGEAYFEIAKYTNGSHQVPFIVRTKAQEVLVLGTQFNLTAYDDEVETRTTLVEGAVVVRESLDGSVKKGTELTPGEESILTTAGLQTRKANLASSIAWKSGVFAFDNIPFDQMMRQIARWYDIDIIYEGAIPKEQFKGKMSRNVDLDVVIGFLKDSGIDLNAEGRTIYIGNSIK